MCVYHGLYVCIPLRMCIPLRLSILLRMYVYPTTFCIPHSTWCMYPAPYLYPTPCVYPTPCGYPTPCMYPTPYVYPTPCVYLTPCVCVSHSTCIRCISDFVSHFVCISSILQPYIPLLYSVSHYYILHPTPTSHSYVLPRVPLYMYGQDLYWSQLRSTAKAQRRGGRGGGVRLYTGITWFENKACGGCVEYVCNVNVDLHLITIPPILFRNASIVTTMEQ